MDENYPGVLYVHKHSVPAGLYKYEPKATARVCYRPIPEDIPPKQAADMIDYYLKLVGVNHVEIATDDMFSLEFVVQWATANASMYYDG